MIDNIDVKAIGKNDLNIADTLRMYLEGDGEVSGPGGRLRGLECLAIAGVLSGTEDNFAIFNNCGGNRFTVWTLGMIGGTAEGFAEFVMKQDGYMFMHKINGVEKIYKTI